MSRRKKGANKAMY